MDIRGTVMQIWRTIPRKTILTFSSSLQQKLKQELQTKRVEEVDEMDLISEEE